ncbi:hypothetical protein QBC35DRAFT_495080 [Podospora australis]|uniref:Carboxymethylenebutenolidase n=1 Tax=Podospora australis TaxID=1536484 RepID=A0AAN7AK20_9PEZI|nr:hypothetical protein QBC35DRAFT_495080 [Podospora australis]
MASSTPFQPPEDSGSVRIQLPLSRQGRGPGLIIVAGDHPAELNQTDEKPLDPNPIAKWAEEGYTVAEITVNDLTSHSDSEAGAVVRYWIQKGLDALKQTKECEGVDFGLITWEKDAQDKHVRNALGAFSEIKAAVLYGTCCCPTEEFNTPAIAHIPSNDRPSSIPKNVTAHNYPSAKDFSFFLPTSRTYHAGSASVSHTRTLSFLKPLTKGPYFDLEAIWDEHTRYEFADRSVEETMKTMVDEPYVNHVPTLTGGIGRAHLTRFYRDHFIFSNPDDAKLELISRTVGIDRVVDEFLFECTHAMTIDWLIPGIPPTGKKLSVPMTSIVNIRGDKLYHEHIAWDQGTVLRQLGLLPEYLPFPYPLPGDQPSDDDEARYEYRVPVAGIQTALKITDENSHPSNEMLEYKVRRVGDGKK